MTDMIKPSGPPGQLRQDDFLKPSCRTVSGAVFDAMVNINKYLQWESRDPFAERQKREDGFECDWDRYACLDYSRLAMEEEAREEEGVEMNVEWSSEEVMDTQL
jgi:serine/threonine-protein phosphatase 2A regulatory subunit B''